MELPVLAVMWVTAAVDIFMSPMEQIEKKRQEFVDKYCEKMNDGSRKVDADNNIVWADFDGFKEDFGEALKATYTVVCKPLLAQMLEAKNPKNEVLLVPAAIKTLREVGLLVSQPEFPVPLTNKPN